MKNLITVIMPQVGGTRFQLLSRTLHLLNNEVILNEISRNGNCFVGNCTIPLPSQFSFVMNGKKLFSSFRKWSAKAEFDFNDDTFFRLNLKKKAELLRQEDDKSTTFGDVDQDIIGVSYLTKADNEELTRAIDSSMQSNNKQTHILRTNEVSRDKDFIVSNSKCGKQVFVERWSEIENRIRKIDAARGGDRHQLEVGNEDSYNLDHHEISNLYQCHNNRKCSNKYIEEEGTENEYETQLQATSEEYSSFSDKRRTIYSYSSKRISQKHADKETKLAANFDFDVNEKSSELNYESMKNNPVYQDLTHNEVKRMQEIYEKKCYSDRKVRWMKLNGLPNPDKEAKMLIRKFNSVKADTDDSQDDLYPMPLIDESIINSNKIDNLEKNAKLKEIASRIRMKIRDEKQANAKAVKTSIPNVSGCVVDPIKYHVQRRRIRVNRMLQIHLEQLLTWNTPYVLYKLLGGISVSIHHIEMKSPRSVCKVYYTITEDYKNPSNLAIVQKNLDSVSKRLRYQMARKLELGYTPEFRFILYQPTKFIYNDRLKKVISQSHNYPYNESEIDFQISEKNPGNIARIVKEMWEKSINGLG